VPKVGENVDLAKKKKRKILNLKHKSKCNFKDCFPNHYL
jgi:hypothetical protein